MGLDSYLYRTKKVEGYTAEDYYAVDRAVSRLVKKEDGLSELNLEAITNIPEANEFLFCIKKRGEYLTWYSIFEEVGYWRKDYDLHRWFVDNVQGGVDKCQPSLVTKKHLEKLLRVVKEDIDCVDLEYTVGIINKVLSETDFVNEVVLYKASW